ncbi:BLUF domain-containing protein [Vibrio sp. SCSIO 43136]|uniref:BLUF domain-containing protein n=1 Tax=Vibrio sp. SCSIO 43136 TaxID=2819101 RepID=UPI00207638A5|nr:BLUF domain-containing protein [Vibrio sp. SCSIO 43136]USD66889.1 BLUF domain-containing protein [Vibrio sp. SCSIO 43136]
MFLSRLIYVSTVTEEFAHSTLDDILLVARENNSEAHVTGMLCFNRKYFLQCLEGSRDAVNNIYNKIAQDRRHTDITILSFEDISEREFVDWSMGYIPTSSLTVPINMKYSGQTEFEPYQMSAKSAYQMLVHLKSELPSV